MAEIQNIVTSAGWLDQCPDGPPLMDFAEIDESFGSTTTFTMGCSCSEKASTGLG